MPGDLISTLNFFAESRYRPMMENRYPLPEQEDEFNSLSANDYDLNTPAIKKVLQEQILPAIHYMTGGKGWRPYLSEKFAESFGVELPEEFYVMSHGDQCASLGIDDIEDHFLGLELKSDAKRRGEPAAYLKFSPELVTAVGMFMLYHGDSMLASQEVPYSSKEQLLQHHLSAKSDLTLGQAIDIGFRNLGSDIYDIITLEDHETMCLLKTGAMIEKDLGYVKEYVLSELIENINFLQSDKEMFYHNRFEIISTANKITQLSKIDIVGISNKIASMYQDGDDIKGVGKSSKIGKIDYDDLYAGNVVRPVIHFLNDAEAKDRTAFIAIFEKPNKSEEDVKFLWNSLNKYDSINKTKVEVLQLRNEILEEINNGSLEQTIFGRTLSNFVNRFA